MSFLSSSTGAAIRESNEFVAFDSQLAVKKGPLEILYKKQENQIRTIQSAEGTEENEDIEDIENADKVTLLILTLRELQLPA